MEVTQEKGLSVDGQTHLLLYQPIERKRLSVSIADIVQLKAASNYTWLFINGMSPFLSSRTLSYYQRLLPSFMRPHKGNLINPLHIQSIAEVETRAGGRFRGLQLVLQDGSLILFSRRQVRAYRRAHKKLAINPIVTIIDL